MSEAARSHQSDNRLEPTMEPPGAIRSDAGDPLAELARVVGQDDPFRNMFRQGKPGARAPSEPAENQSRRVEQGYYESDVVEADHPAEPFLSLEETHALGLRSSVHEYEAETALAQWDDAHVPEFAEQGPQGAYDDQAYADDQRYRDAPMPIDAPHYVAPPLTPDLWAEHAEAAGSEGSDHAPVLADETAADSPSPRRSLIVLMAILLLTGGGLAATFLSRTSQNVVMNGGSAPTIMAASGPTKIKQSEGDAAPAPVDADAALLSTKVGSAGPVHVVNSQEQPIDLGQLPKGGGGPADATNASSPFPEPRKVKTFLVRPDGTLVNSSSAAPAPVHPTVPAFAAGAAMPSDGSDAAPAPAARPSTPKTGSSAVTTPKTAPVSIADATDTDGQDAAPKAGQPGAKTADAQSVETAPAAAPDATASTGGGGFAVQLAASPSEQEARSTFTKLQKKFSELGKYQPTVKKADNGQKTVYRLRVGNLSRDQAKSLCSTLQASGGSCFVIHS